MCQKEKLLVLSNFFFCHYVFKKLSAAEASESVYMRERVKPLIYVPPWQYLFPQTCLFQFLIKCQSRFHNKIISTFTLERTHIDFYRSIINYSELKKRWVFKISETLVWHSNHHSNPMLWVLKRLNSVVALLEKKLDLTLSLIRQFCSRRLWTYFVKT